MKTRTLFISILGTLLISGLSLSQEPELPQPPVSGPPTQATPPQRQRTDPLTDRSSSGSEMVTRIFVLHNVSVDELQDMLSNVFNINKVYSDRRSNRLIVQATQGQMKDVTSLIEMMDVTDSGSAITQAIQNLVYRIYMFEIPSNDQEMKPFSMILQVSGKVTSATILSVAAKEKIEVSDYVIISERENEQVEILLQGRAPSNESIQKIAELTGIQIKELKWDDDTFTKSVEAAQHSQLPAQMQKYLQKFLGENIVTVGYWFGSSSVPGKVEAPIGPWKLRLELETESDRELELRVEVEAAEQMSHFERRLGRERSNEILSNTIRAKVGKPIIIGYNRESYGTRKMGAMVILPETIQLNTSEPTTP